MMLLSSSRLDAENNRVQTFVEKQRLGEDETYKFSQFHGGLDNFAHEKIIMTKSEFFSLFPAVWVVETWEEYKSGGFHGMFHTEESAVNKLYEIIAAKSGQKKECISLHLDSFVSDGQKLMSYEYDFFGYVFTAYQIRIQN